MSDEPTIEMRVTVDGTTHPIHDDAQSLSAVLVYVDSGPGAVRMAEVQIAKMGDMLNIVIAGDVERPGRVDARGNTIIQVFPTERENK